MPAHAARPGLNVARSMLATRTAEAVSASAASMCPIGMCFVVCWIGAEKSRDLSLKLQS